MHEYSSGTQERDVALPELIRALQNLAVPADDGVCVDQIRLLEQVKSVAAAAQARVTAGFVASQRASQREAGVPEARCERGIAAQVGLAMRTSPHRARKYVGWSRILTTELPETFARLQAGDTTEWRAMLVARESAWLSREHRAMLDRELAPGWNSWAIGRLSPRRRRSRTGWTRKGMWPGSVTLRPSGECPCVRPRM